MNTAEALTESYFRLVRGCFTVSDVKVERGMGRQFDLLALNPKTGEQFHVETSVKLDRAFNYDVNGLVAKLERKFFGAPKQRGQKSCLAAIKKTYESVGLDYERLTRVFVPWIMTDDSAPAERATARFHELARGYGIKRPKFELLLFRDQLLPELMGVVGSQHYDDSLVRLLSLMAAAGKQTAPTACRLLKARLNA